MRTLMNNRRNKLLQITLIALLSGPCLTSADEPSEATKIGRFLRLRRTEEGDVTALETAIVRYRKPGQPAGTDLVVDLIGAIHIAEKDYYERINKRFDDYDVVLYELVAPDEKTVPQPGRRSASPVTAMQVGMKDLLGLDFQLDCIDYRKSNLVRADLTTREFSKSMNDRGESFLQLFFRMMGQGIALQSKDPAGSNDARFFAAFFAKDRATQLKRVMAEEFERSLALPSVLEGPDGSTIITVRNRRAVDELEEQLGLGKKRVAIFYGAAHLPDLERQLHERFGLKSVETTWLVAWKIESEQ